MNTLFILIFLLSIPALAIGLVKPGIFAGLLKHHATRKKVGLMLGSIFIGSFILAGVTSGPVPNKTENASDQQVVKQEQVVNEVQNVPTATQEAKSVELLLVSKVVDGDTIEVQKDDKKVSVRLIGINTPETVDPRKGVECFGKEASNKAKEILVGKRVRLEADDSQDQTDKYGRTLAYVYLEDGTNFNKLMVSEGYAYEYTYERPYKYQSDFKAEQSSAQTNKRGLWNDQTCKGSLEFPVTPSPNPAPPSNITPPNNTPPSTTAPAPSSGVVKKSTTGICHAPGTTYYARTTNFTAYNSTQTCLDSGGRLPKR